mmetsp:Transcript_17532/g.31204  ORF Transcript_17532/g.31204 Transcript_17532/m.31204 type:complete len:239 (-) Transcript_17532:3076-3792(-)
MIEIVFKMVRFGHKVYNGPLHFYKRLLMIQKRMPHLKPPKACIHLVCGDLSILERHLFCHTLILLQATDSSTFISCEMAETLLRAIISTFFNSICKKYHTDDSSLCDDTLVNKIELWSRLNLDVLSWGRQHLRPEQFLVVRIEDFVLGDPACFWRLANFTGTSKERAQITIAKSVRLFTVKRSRYFGLKYTASQVEEYSNALDKNPYIGRAFKALGYGIRPWRPEGPCTQIPTFGFDT